ncbi:IS21 family transposase [Rhizorhapis sp. SPR117]|uniref:IS21 family transposase n=1 Tax=Rhizorhapis sp. SPR117 TaxID=2912611 RepID=UPI001F022946|nr:IS21 family transposase [Rhizorhapis sp. SPR117]
MRRVREILRLIRDAGVPVRQVARQLGVAPSTVRETLRRFDGSGLEWPLPAALSDAVLESQLYGAAGTKQDHRRREEPDWAAVNRELKRKHVTLQIVWDEYIETHPDGYRYSRFCELYRGWEARLPVTMRQTHLGGDRMFVDYAGDRVPVVIDRLTGEIRDAHIFVAVMGASSLSFGCATWTETLPDWVEAHVRAFAYFGGSARLLVPDNAKVAVIKACLYDPQVNRTYADLAAHYGAGILAARPYRPRDKAKVENCVGFVERWLLGRLRHRVWHSLAELNAAIADLLTRLNDERVMRRFGQTRRQLFEDIDAPLLKPLPAEPYVLAQWRKCRVGLDYHVEVEKHFYSVPYRHARAAVEVRITARTVEIFAIGERIAAHMRGSGNGRHTTINDHMPSSHRRYADWTIERIVAEAGLLGPSVKLLCEMILQDRPHPEQGYRSCLGILRLAKPYGASRLDAAALRALEIGARNYGSVKSILEKKLDGQPLRTTRTSGEVVSDHPNIRGSNYYH